MSTPAGFLSALGQALAAHGLYDERHPMRARAVDAVVTQLQRLLDDRGVVQLSLLDGDVLLGREIVRELRGWDWARRLSRAGVQRIEVAGSVTPDDVARFVQELAMRLGGSSSADLTTGLEVPGSIRWGALGVRSDSLADPMPESRDDDVPVDLQAESDAIAWLHEEVGRTGRLPLAEAAAVVRSLSLAMHRQRELVVPLLELRRFDQYTTSHALNVSVLAIALAEALGADGVTVRAYGVAGLLHDLGKVRVPREVLLKPGALTAEELEIIRRHPADGARLILSRETRLDVAAAVAYEHHLLIDGGGYPARWQNRRCHPASALVHVCDVYDALRTTRPYRDPWDSERALRYIEEHAGTQFDPDVVTAFSAMMRRVTPRYQAMPESV
jgi:putative nucleotidyltransferase with HDIG domain